MHISEQIANKLIIDGWDDRKQINGDTLFYKRLPTGGEIGESIRILRLDITGRWLESVNGWGEVEREVDLREHHNNPDNAINSILI